jgi:hypothetical protein
LSRRVVDDKQNRGKHKAGKAFLKDRMQKAVGITRRKMVSYERDILSDWIRRKRNQAGLFDQNAARSRCRAGWRSPSRPAWDTWKGIRISLY